MKRIIYQLWMAVCVMLVAVSCSDDDKHSSGLPQINLEFPRYSLAKGDVTVRLMADAPVASDVQIPFSFYGEAVEGTDYTVSAHAFAFKAGAKEAEITITRMDEHIGEKSSELTLNLDRKAVPEGFQMGLLNYTTIELMGNNAVIMSFDKSSDLLTLSSSYAITLEKLDGSRYKVPSETEFALEIDPASTAIEGVHYEFVGKQAVVVPKDKNTGTVELKFLKKEEGKDKLVLRLAEKDGYAYGSNAAIAITIQGPESYNGTWAFSKIVNAEWWTNSWGVDTSTFPQGTSEDQITFTGDSYEAYTFTPSLKGDLKNYFIGECAVTFQGEREEIYYEESTISQVKANIAVLKFEKVNVNFSATNSKVRSAVVGFRIITVEGKETLECTIYDYEPTDFLKDVYDMYVDWGYDPVMLEAPLRLHFTRVK